MPLRETGEGIYIISFFNFFKYYFLQLHMNLPLSKKKKKLTWIKCFAYKIENIAEQAILSIQKTIT